MGFPRPGTVQKQGTIRLVGYQQNLAFHGPVSIQSANYNKTEARGLARRNSRDIQHRSSWKSLWHAKVPAKIRMFLWTRETFTANRRFHCQPKMSGNIETCLLPAHADIAVEALPPGLYYVPMYLGSSGRGACGSGEGVNRNSSKSMAILDDPGIIA